MAWWTNSEIVIKSKYRFVLTIGGRLFMNVKSVTKPTVNVEKKEFRLTNHYYKYPGLVKWDSVEITMIDADGIRGNIPDTYFGFKKTDSTDPTLQAIEGSYSFNIPDGSGGTAFKAISENKGFQTDSWAAANFLEKLLSNGGYSNPDGTSNNNTLEKAAVMDAAFGGAGGGVNDVRIIQIDPSGQPVETWTLINPIFTKISWGSLDYSSDDNIEYTLTVDYDWAEFTNKSTKAARESLPTKID